jgi:hypothetical protein
MVDWTAYNHTVNYSNVIDSWFGNLLSGKVLYPVADWHIGLSYCKVPVIDNNLYQGGLAINDLRPALLLTEMVKACFADIGYTLSGSLFDRDNFTDLFVIPMNGAGPIQNTNNEDAKINVSITSYTTPSVTGNVKIIFPTVTSDPLSLYNSTTGIYTVPYTGTYTVQLSGSVSARTGATFFKVITNGGLTQFGSVGATGAFTGTVIVNLNKGDTLTIQQQTRGVTVFASINFQIIQVPYGINNSTLNFEVVMPPMKVSDFINGFLKTFNAVLIPVGATEFALHNIDDYYALGVKKDWTRYIDMVDIKHEKVPIPKQITMSHAEAEDIANVQYTSVNNQAYGSVKASPEVDFADDALEIQSPFTLLVPSLIREKSLNNVVLRDTELQIPVLLDGDFKPVKADLYLVYFVERRTIAVDTYQLEGIDQFSYPLISSYQDFPTTSATNSLAFGMEATISGNAPTNTLYVEFFRTYLSRVMSSKSRIVYFSSVLPVNEWLQLEMNDTISVSGNLYKIQNIQYDILNERGELVLISYPNINVQTYTSSGNNTGWTNGATNTDGLTTLNGDAVGRGVTNSKPQFGGGTGVMVLGQKTFGQTNMQKVRDIVNELVKDRSVAVVFNSAPVTIVTPNDNTYIKVGLNTVQSLGNTYYFTNASGSVTINASARYKVTSEISIDHPKNHDITCSILINGLVTSAYANLERTTHTASISEVFDLTVGSIIEVAFSCLQNHAVTIEVVYCKLRLEKI